MNPILIPRITVVECNGRHALLVWADQDGYGIEYADGSRDIVQEPVFVRRIEDGEDWNNTTPTVAIDIQMTLNRRRDARQMLATAGHAIARTSRTLLRTLRAILAVARRHVPAWLSGVLTVCLIIPGPLDELAVLLVITAMIGIKAEMRADLTRSVRIAWKG